MDGYADDLAAVIEALDLTDAMLVGHSTGGGEVARYTFVTGLPEVALPHQNWHRAFLGRGATPTKRGE